MSQENNNENGGVLSINVAEDISMEDMGLGGQSPTKSAPEQDPIARYKEEIMPYLKRYVAPHKNKSRWVKQSDVERVLKDGEIIVILCSIPRGIYGNISAIAHPQIDDQDPLRFFALPNGMLVINPVLINHTKVPVFKEEGCASFPEEPIKTMLPRYHKVEVIYQTLVQKKNANGGEHLVLSDPQRVDLSGPTAQVFQHECQHLNGGYIYDTDYVPEKSIGFGDGDILDISGLKKKYITNKHLFPRIEHETQTQGKTCKKNDDKGRTDNKGTETVRDSGVAEEERSDPAENGKTD